MIRNQSVPSASLLVPCPRKAHDTYLLDGQLGERMGARRGGKAWGRQEPQRPGSILFLMVGYLAPALMYLMVGTHYLKVSFIPHFLSTYYELGTIIGTRDKDKNTTRPLFGRSTRTEGGRGLVCTRLVTMLSSVVADTYTKCDGAQKRDLVHWGTQGGIREVQFYCLKISFLCSVQTTQFH